MGESGRKMFALLILPSAALAWRPAPGIPLERQIPANRQFTSTGSGSGSGGCEYEPYIQECNATEIWCDSGSYNGCWYGNYCLQQINEWDGCPGVCHMPCDWDTQDYCDMGYDSNHCWLGNYCMDRESGGCPTMPGSGSMDYGSTDYGTSGVGSCFEAYTQECNSTEIYCDAGMDSEGCWFGNYCINQVNEWDGCYGVCSMNCNWETEDWCDMGTDSNGCWMGNWCQDFSLGGCPDVNMISKRGFMEKQKAMAHRADFGSGSAGFDYGSGSAGFDYGSDFWSNYGSDYGYDYSSGSDYGFGSGSA